MRLFVLGAAQNAIITALYDQEYMAAVKEKIKIIKAFGVAQQI